MAEKAHLLAFVGQQFRVIGAVWVVAGRATARQRGVHVLLLQHLLHIDVTADAQLFTFLQQECLVVRLVRCVAGSTVSCGDRAVNELEVHVIRMTTTTDLLHRLRQQLGLIGGMWIVARRAHSALNGEVHHLLVPEFLMARVTEVGRILRELERLLALLRMRGFHGLVTAVAGFGNRMNRRALQQLRVAVSRDATLLPDGRSAYEQGTADQQWSKHEASGEGLLSHAPIPSLHGPWWHGYSASRVGGVVMGHPVTHEGARS